MDLSVYEGCGVDSVSLSAEQGSSGVQIVLCRGPETVVTLRFVQVVYVMVDGPDDGLDLVDRITSRVLPCRGAWPPEAGHLIHHHNNVTELVWVVLDGPTRIDVLAGSLELG